MIPHGQTGTESSGRDSELPLQSLIQKMCSRFIIGLHAVLKNIRAQLRLAAVLSLSRARMFFSTAWLVN